MPTADLRALAKRVGLLKPCGGHVQPCPDWCGRSDGVLPTEAEVRAAIFEAGPSWVEIGSGTRFAYVMFGRDSEHRATASVTEDEVTSDELVLLALVRALEVVHG